MSAIVFNFPAGLIIGPEDQGVLPALRPGGKALVIAAIRDGFMVRMEPASTDRERAVRMRFPTATEARAYAALMRRQTPGFYQWIIDKTGGAA